MHGEVEVILNVPQVKPRRAWGLWSGIALIGFGAALLSFVLLTGATLTLIPLGLALFAMGARSWVSYCRRHTFPGDSS